MRGPNFDFGHRETADCGRDEMIAQMAKLWLKLGREIMFFFLKIDC